MARLNRVRGSSGSRWWPLSAVLIPLLAMAAVAEGAAAQSLRGGSASIRAQNAKARQYDYTFLTNPAHVRRFVDLGLLVRIHGNRHYRLDNEVSFPYARPEVKVFLERLGRQYHSACGEQLVVTSLTRPQNRQPRNSSSLSVHPTGMAVDLRRSLVRKCRSWLEEVLLHLERAGAVEAAYERRPPHYHVAVYTQDYARYVAALGGGSRVASAPDNSPPRGVGTATEETMLRYEVRRGDTLWDIARTYGTTVDELRSANRLAGSRIYAGQLLEVRVESR